MSNINQCKIYNHEIKNYQELINLEKAILDLYRLLPSTNNNSTEYLNIKYSIQKLKEKEEKLLDLVVPFPSRAIDILEFISQDSNKKNGIINNILNDEDKDIITRKTTRAFYQYIIDNLSFPDIHELYELNDPSLLCLFNETPIFKTDYEDLVNKLIFDNDCLKDLTRNKVRILHEYKQNKYKDEEQLIKRIIFAQIFSYNYLEDIFLNNEQELFTYKSLNHMTHKNISVEEKYELKYNMVLTSSIDNISSILSIDDIFIQASSVRKYIIENLASLETSIEFMNSNLFKSKLRQIIIELYNSKEYKELVPNSHLGYDLLINEFTNYKSETSKVLQFTFK